MDANVVYALPNSGTNNTGPRRMHDQSCNCCGTADQDEGNMSFSSTPMHLFLLSSLLLTFANAATFDAVNNCRRLDCGQSWNFNVNPNTGGARIWARTNCNFDDSGCGHCETGNCVLECRGYGQPPNTLAEYALNQFNNLDFFDISLIDGFNVPMDFSPTGSGCRGIRSGADINGQCPGDLRAPEGCNNPCAVYKTDQFCCTGSFNRDDCPPTDKSRFFKDRCRDAYSYPKDDRCSTFICPGGTNYRVVFCP
ncbi:LOW QUALITY PROTEIN: hypothetical protein Sjap_026158 [Stephania japonica]|uniref:Thaumatin-like protein n=1 Tax=Stephania japonica TaxID=461633 RepID=A0AAP0E6H5_9MAGN